MGEKNNGECLPKRTELISLIEEKLEEASAGAIIPLEKVKKSTRNSLVSYFERSRAYKIDEEVVIDPNNMKKSTKYNLYIMRRN